MVPDGLVRMLDVLLSSLYIIPYARTDKLIMKSLGSGQGGARSSPIFRAHSTRSLQSMANHPGGSSGPRLAIWQTYNATRAIISECT